MNSKRILSTAFGLAGAIAIPTGLSAAGHVPHPTVPAYSATARQTPPPAAAKMKLGLTYENWAAPSTAIVANTPLALDNPTQIKCPAAAGCRMIAEVAAMIAVINAPGSAGLCVYLDGNDANPGCNYISKVDPASGEVTLSNRLNYTMSAGFHTVQTFLVSQSAGTMYSYQADYALYKSP